MPWFKKPKPKPKQQSQVLLRRPSYSDSGYSTSSSDEPELDNESTDNRAAVENPDNDLVAFFKLDCSTSYALGGCYSPSDDNKVAIAFGDQTVRVFDFFVAASTISTPESNGSRKFISSQKHPSVIKEIKKLGGQVRSVAWNATSDGKMSFISCGMDSSSTIRCFDVNDDYKEISGNGLKHKGCINTLFASWSSSSSSSSSENNNNNNNDIPQRFVSACDDQTAAVFEYYEITGKENEKDENDAGEGEMGREETTHTEYSEDEDDDSEDDISYSDSSSDSDAGYSNRGRHRRQKPLAILPQHIYSTKYGCRRIKTLSHTSSVYHAIFSTNDKFILTATTGRGINVYDGQNSFVKIAFLNTLDGDSVAISSDNRYVTVSGLKQHNVKRFFCDLNEIKANFDAENNNNSNSSSAKKSREEEEKCVTINLSGDGDNFRSNSSDSSDDYSDDSSDSEHSVRQNDDKEKKVTQPKSKEEEAYSNPNDDDTTQQQKQKQIITYRNYEGNIFKNRTFTCALSPDDSLLCIGEWAYNAKKSNLTVCDAATGNNLKCTPNFTESIRAICFPRSRSATYFPKTFCVCGTSGGVCIFRNKNIEKRLKNRMQVFKLRQGLGGADWKMCFDIHNLLVLTCRFL